MDFCDLAVDGVRRLSPYQPGKPISELQREIGIQDVVKLASNENPLGPSPLAVDAARDALAQLARYPDGGGFDLKAALALRHGVDQSCITLGNGSNDVLDMVARAFLGPGRSAVFSEHAFAVYPIATQAVGASARIAPAKNHGHDLQAMAAAVAEDTRVVFIANPNNPTGGWLGSAELEGFLGELPGNVICVVDEAYFEYVDRPDYPDSSQWLERFENLIVCRTFSKAYGLAGLRVGYSLCGPAIADLLNRVRQPFNNNSIALAAAEAALGDREHLQQAIALNRDGMALYERAFTEMGLDWIPSVGNFVCVRLDRPGTEVYRALLGLGVITRPVANYGLPNHLRISIGTLAENQRCVDALRTILDKSP
ncbi:MAG: histidinol-phosphate transaminase [Chromatiales bacterium]|nr:histidinol-phosphate transaminase [Chromatiales bacterium]